MNSHNSSLLGIIISLSSIMTHCQQGDEEDSEEGSEEEETEEETEEGSEEDDDEYTDDDVIVEGEDQVEEERQSGDGEVGHCWLKRLAFWSTVFRTINI